MNRWPGRAKRTKAEPLPAVGRLLAMLSVIHPELPPPSREWQFLWPIREWAFDLAWPHVGLAIEVDGGVWTRGRHTRGDGYAEDCVKLAAAAGVGWVVIRIPSAWLNQDYKSSDWNRVLIMVRAGVEAAGSRNTTPAVAEWMEGFKDVKPEVRKSKVVRAIHRSQVR